MRFLALVFALISGPTVSLGIGEFENQIAAANTIEEKISLAEDGFKTIEGFVPRELFMSYWSIDALEDIVSTYESILDSEGMEGLVPEYSNIARICAMEMGDYRYFFEPLKKELEEILQESREESDKWKLFTRNSDAIRKDALSFWSMESIHSLIEFWILSGEGEDSPDIDALLKKRWSESDIEYWDYVFSQSLLSPNQIINAIKSKLLSGHDYIYILDTSFEKEYSFWVAPAISQSKSEVSSGGPRLD